MRFINYTFPKLKLKFIKDSECTTQIVMWGAIFISRHKPSIRKKWFFQNNHVIITWVLSNYHPYRGLSLFHKFLTSSQGEVLLTIGIIPDTLLCKKLTNNKLHKKFCFWFHYDIPCRIQLNIKQTPLRSVSKN